MLNKLIKAVQIYVGKKLTVEISDGQAPAMGGMKQGLMGGKPLRKSQVSPHHRIKCTVVENQQFTEPEGIGIRAFSANKIKQYPLVDAHKIISDVKLKIESSLAAVNGNLSNEFLKAGNSPMDALSFTAGIGVMDEAGQAAGGTDAQCLSSARSPGKRLSPFA